MLFIHQYTSSGKNQSKINTANVDKRTILDKTIIMKQSNWDIS